MQQKAAVVVVGPRFGTDRRSSRSCGSAKDRPERGRGMFWLGAHNERDLTSNYDGAGGLQCDGNEQACSAADVHRVRTYLEGGCHR